MQLSPVSYYQHVWESKRELQGISLLHGELDTNHLLADAIARSAIIIVVYYNSERITQDTYRR